MTLTAIVLLVTGYTVALTVLARVRRVFADRRVRSFVALEAGMVAIVVGWWLREEAVGVVINGAAVIGLGIAWWITDRRTRSSRR